MYRARSGFSAAIAFAIGTSAGLTPVVVFPAGSGESANTTNVQVPLEAAGPVVIGISWAGAWEGAVHPPMQAMAITVRNNASISSRMAVYYRPDQMKALISHENRARSWEKIIGRDPVYSGQKRGTPYAPFPLV
jgi:hypothetical protein